MLTNDDIKDTVENYIEKLIVREKLQNRLISLGGRDFEQESALLQRLEEIEGCINSINRATDGDGVLSLKESAAVDMRIDGMTLEMIGSVFGNTRERVRQILNDAYSKIAAASSRGRRRRR